VRRGSSYYGTLATLNQQLTAAGKPPIVIQIAPDDEETDSLLEKVSRGEILYTMADDLLANLHTAYWPALVIGPAISAERQLAWAVRPGDVKLRQAIDDVFSELRKKPDFNLLKRKYFEAKRSLRQERKDQFYASDTGALSSYDPLFRKYAGQHGFDWRLVAAQILPGEQLRPAPEELDRSARPLPDHARHGEGAGHRGPVGCRAVESGRAQVHDQLRKRYKDVADPIERHRFALAAYNTGFGHVDDARRLASATERTPRCGREVAPYLLKLSDPRVARKTRFGHCRGTEPVDYVQDIDERYTAYVQLLPASKPAEIQSD